MSEPMTADEYLERLIPLIQVGQTEILSGADWGDGEWLPHGYFPGYSGEYPGGADDS